MIAQWMMKTNQDIVGELYIRFDDIFWQQVMKVKIKLLS